jgi:hypothetical protein
LARALRVLAIGIAPNPACCNLNFASRMVCNRCKTPPSGAAMYLHQAAALWYATSRGLTAPRLPGPVFQPTRPGDWACLSCANHNYASRVVCNRCHVPKPSNPPPPVPLLPVFPGLPFPRLDGIGPPPIQAVRPGDWMCPDCGNHNYASRLRCNRCTEPKPVAPTQPI